MILEWWALNSAKDLKEGLTSTLNFVSERQIEILKLVKQNAAAIYRVLNIANALRSVQGFDNTQSSFHLAQQSAVYGLAQSYEE